MHVELSADGTELAKKAASLGADRIRSAISARGDAAIILATGASQFETVEALCEAPGIDWSRVTAFHLDEYVGLPVTHGASFRRYLKERFVDRVGPVKDFIYIAGDVPDVAQEVARVSDIISRHVIDVAFVGIGENGHLAFNDPPADFEITDPYLMVELDTECRQQQFGEGWFPTLSDVPTRAISMSVREILRSETLVCAVPDARKAEAVRNALQGPVSNMCPASIMQTHDAAYIFIEPASASHLDADWLATATA